VLGYHFGLHQHGADELKQAKIYVKNQLLYNFCYTCLCGATLMACDSWKVVLIE